MESTKSDVKFFILTKINHSKHVQRGSLCSISNSRYESEYITRKRATIHVTGMGSNTEEVVLISDMVLLSTKEAELLYALDGNDTRLKWFQEKTALKSAVGLTIDTRVTVMGYIQDLQGIIRYIGPFTKYTYAKPNTISGTFFGIELQGNDKGKGQYGGITSKSFFQCENNNGLLVPFSKIQPIVPSSLTLSTQQASSQKHSNQITKGETVRYVDDKSQALWLVMGVGDQDGEPMVNITTDDRTINVPMNFVTRVITEHKEPNLFLGASAASVEPQTYSETVLGVDSLIEFNLAECVGYGVIRWIGVVPDRKDTMCGLELEEPRGTSDGTFKGKRYFSCPPKKALFVKLESCRPDTRFSIPSSAKPGITFAHQKHEDEDTRHEGPCDTVEHIQTDQVDRILIGRMKGIQGHCNSCYMDAALFSLFSCTSVLDSLLFKTLKPEDEEIQNTLLRDIVNPLRSKGFVEGRHIMKLRQQLLNHGYSHTFTTHEKDPEEFLTIIMQHIMALEPLLKLSTAGKVQESYCYQIFLDQNHSLVLPTIQQLLEHSFHSNGLKLAEAPSCLILQMPRFGKKFKMFEKIIPSLELDVTDLLTEGPQYCILCGQIALIECTECFKDPVFSQTGFKVFCETCSAQVHSPSERQAHRLSKLLLPKGFQESLRVPPEKMELFAVLCIETSHYVSFVKHGPKSQDWIFFDSMADREGGLNGYNIPVIEACPEVGEYLDMPPAELANQVPRDMKGVAKRLFCDAYMYLYRNPALEFYR
ncbi:ubiquitin carboxyl-terminal hydrolase CYLD isoform X3 [Gadus macrocephalus]|uniref:ubiquitin carboxyl-terminal hydrolase CYLD isoform X3 n=1 Tax=Gadus macrocephalus TaxID=80720 RepID=UPI0028CB23E6|nr:ubiquitin carboxyl-terminal hydrolase CYLD isoform X3 [Gadus macrocephalus]